MAARIGQLVEAVNATEVKPWRWRKLLKQRGLRRWVTHLQGREKGRIYFRL